MWRDMEEWLQGLEKLAAGLEALVLKLPQDCHKNDGDLSEDVDSTG